MTLANPAGLWLALLAIPVLALHMLRPRRVPVAVSSPGIAYLFIRCTCIDKSPSASLVVSEAAAGLGRLPEA